MKLFPEVIDLILAGMSSTKVGTSLSWLDPRPRAPHAIYKLNRWEIFNITRSEKIDQRIKGFATEAPSVNFTTFWKNVRRVLCYFYDTSQSSSVVLSDNDILDDDVVFSEVFDKSGFESTDILFIMPKNTIVAVSEGIYVTISLKIKLRFSFLFLRVTCDNSCVRVTHSNTGDIIVEFFNSVGGFNNVRGTGE